VEFVFNEDQQMLADTVTRWLDAEYDLESRRRFAAQETLCQDNWSRLTELGLLGLNIPEEHGGLGATPVETLIVMQAFGRGLLVEPFLSTAVVAAKLLSGADAGAQHGVVLKGIAEGLHRVSLAALEPGARFDLADIRTSAVESGGDYVLNGRKAVVLHGDSARSLIVSARTSCGQRDREGITLFLVDASLHGVTVRGFPTIDGQRAAEVELSNVAVSPVAIIGQRGFGYEPLEWAVDAGIAALCAEAIGVMEKLMEFTAEHLRTRKQFGQPIGRFQALQHRVADMQTAIEQARSMALLAAARADHPDRIARRKALSAAKAMVGRAGRFVGEQAVQLHGAMGMTADLAAGWYFKRLTCIDMTWGNAEHHVEIYGDLL
jgi:alkylation response protein AidB-like acyl-CoA dehydrogenase